MRVFFPHFANRGSPDVEPRPDCAAFIGISTRVCVQLSRAPFAALVSRSRLWRKSSGFFHFLLFLGIFFYGFFDFSRSVLSAYVAKHRLCHPKMCRNRRRQAETRGACLQLHFGDHNLIADIQRNTVLLMRLEYSSKSTGFSRRRCTSMPSCVAGISMRTSTILPSKYFSSVASFWANTADRQYHADCCHIECISAQCYSQQKFVFHKNPFVKLAVK